jgi:putative IMPACT (imprinted ancient) family translation regulator
MSALLISAVIMTSSSRSNDNKEPSGTAGVPMLEALQYSGLSNVCVCVVRYFGGIKLGTGGLSRAYSQCGQRCSGSRKKSGRYST